MMPSRKDAEYRVDPVARTLWDLAAHKANDPRFEDAVEVPIEAVREIAEDAFDDFAAEAQSAVVDLLRTDEPLLASALDMFWMEHDGRELVRVFAAAATQWILNRAAGLPAPDRPVHDAANRIFHLVETVSDSTDRLVGPYEVGYEEWEELDGVFYDPRDGSELYIPQRNFYYSSSDVSNFISDVVGLDTVARVIYLLEQVYTMLLEDYEFWLDGIENG